MSCLGHNYLFSIERVIVKNHLFTPLCTSDSNMTGQFQMLREIEIERKILS